MTTGRDLIAAPIAAQVIPAQASSDVEMIALWLRNYRAANTVSAYQSDVRAFQAFYSGPLRKVTVRLLQDFADTLTGLSDATVGRRLSAVKSLFGFAHRIGYLPFDVGAPISLPAIKDKIAERIMAEEAVQRLLWQADAPHRRGPYLKRDAALLRLLYTAGLRISEACGLRWRDLVERDDAGQITVFGKGGKTRVILLPAAIWSRLIALRGTGDDNDPVFKSRKNGALNRSQVHCIVKLASKRAGLSGSISAHYLRHSHASHALDRGAPVHVVQTTLGHASLTTTTRYVHARPGDSSSRYLPV
jgi:site-specific recombinase XerD